MPSKNSTALSALSLLVAEAGGWHMGRITQRKSRAKSAAGAKEKAIKKRRAANKRARAARKKNRSRGYR